MDSMMEQAEQAEQAEALGEAGGEAVRKRHSSELRLPVCQRTGHANQGPPLQGA